MFNFINNIFDIKSEEEYLEKYEPEYKKIRNITGLLLLLSFFSIFLVLSTFIFANKSKDINLRLVNPAQKTLLVGLYDTPLFSNESMQSYIKNVMINMFDINFVNADSKMETYKKYFTDLGWEMFSNNFRKNYVDILKKKSLTSTLVFDSEPLLIGTEQWLDGTKRWRYGFTVYMFNKGSTANLSKAEALSKNVVVLTLRTTDNKEAVSGVVIDSMDISISTD